MPNKKQSTPTRFELGHLSDPAVQQRYIDSILNNVDNCLARRVAIGISATLPAIGSGPSRSTNANTTVPSFYPLISSLEPNKSNAGLVIGILADGLRLSASYLAASTPRLTFLRCSKSSSLCQEAYGDGKAIAALGTGVQTLQAVGISVNAGLRVSQGSPAAAVTALLDALAGPVRRFPQRLSVDDLSIFQ